MSICTGISLVETLPSGDELLKVTIDNSTEAFWFYRYSDALAYLNQEVIVEYRKDVYKGELAQFIATFVKPTVIQTLSKEDNIKLYCDMVDNNANLSFSEIAIGETRPGCIVYCVACEFKSSNNATWQELIIRDKSMRTAKLRLFDYDNKAANFAGQYVMTELSRNKFGFQSEFINPVAGEVPPNPELEISKKYIQNYFANDSNALAYIAKTGVIGFLEEAIDYEKGYGLVRLARELAVLDAMKNITKDVDLKSIGQALLASRGYLVRNSVLSNSVNNVIQAYSIKWDNTALVLQLLDTACEEDIPEKKVMQSITSTVSTLIEVQKGTVD